MKIAALSVAVIGVGGLLFALSGAMSSSAPALTGPSSKVGSNPGNVVNQAPGILKPSNHDQLAAFSGGCFWGTEDIFRQVKGVVSTAVGYTGGSIANPTYEQVCTHTTGHAETVLIEFDPSKVTYKQLLATFWENHDPTTVDQQGPDFGNNYRSAIWTFSDTQVKEAKASLAEAQSKLTHKIVTTIKPAEPFYIAEDYHQQYDEKHGTHFCPIGHGS
jgi:peptide-methionine (S)-S-oxide reductase